MRFLQCSCLSSFRATSSFLLSLYESCKSLPTSYTYLALPKAPSTSLTIFSGLLLPESNDPPLSIPLKNAFALSKRSSPNSGWTLIASALKARQATVSVLTKLLNLIFWFLLMIVIISSKFRFNLYPSIFYPRENRKDFGGKIIRSTKLPLLHESPPNGGLYSTRSTVSSSIECQRLIILLSI